MAGCSLSGDWSDRIDGGNQERNVKMDGQASNHLRLAVQPGTVWPYVIAGDRDDEIGCHFACARDAEAAIRAFCREHRVSATVRVFYAAQKAVEGRPDHGGGPDLPHAAQMAVATYVPPANASTRCLKPWIATRCLWVMSCRN